MQMNLNAYYRPSVEWDVEFLAPWLRPMDKQTIRWMTDMTAHDGLEYTFSNSAESNSIVVNDTVVGMFGVAGVTGQEGSPWLLMSDFLDTSPHLKKLFLVECRRWIEAKKLQYKRLWNFVYKDHKQHIQWLKWLGFKVKDLYPQFGPYKKPFLYFEMEGKI